ncbi:RHS repeat-associated core domain-containing protein [Catellatospora sp. TT07R-123]|uniref:RHS repeat-associated core domain-containing protein n=1 Tax=Catellatospora sp. TT07R-123 TaxID=2733863 RepID=UPI001BB410E4|nr:RHS repeat-associated core domain-containing protein [Catellatospora sp. TT07R-123]
MLSPLQPTPAAAAPAHLGTQTEPVAPGSDGHVLHAKPAAIARNLPVNLPAPAWPQHASAKVDLSAAVQSKTAARASNLPVTVQRGAAASVGDLSAVTVEVVDRDAVPATWRNGTVVRVNRADGKTSASSTQLSVDYTSFRNAFGGDWASRLRLWLLPECALTTPDQANCRAVALKSRNDQHTGTVTAEVPLAAASAPTGTASAQLAGDTALSAGGAVVALAAGASGSSGDFAASSLQPSGSWQAGGNSGDFSWTYPLSMPPSAGGPVPSISLAYSSSSVDGRSSATNNQPSWLGEGFEYSPGYIERRYIPCSEDTAGSPNNAGNPTGDMCWRSDNATMSLNGHGGELLKNGSVWRAKSDDGSKIEKLTGGTNGDNDGEYWRVITTDGTQYFFGRNTLPGQSTTTNSAWTMPVYGNHTGDPCRGSSFATSACTQVWRWNLDYVVDPRGNTMSFWYDTETNQYAARNTDTNKTQYVRGGMLRRIDYGTYYRTLAEHQIAETSIAPTGQVLFDPADRCLTSCWSGTDPTTQNWPDTPWDQNCKTTATSCPGLYSPTFWSTKRLNKITTQVWDTTKTTPAWQPVDSWTMTYTFPDVGDGSTNRGMWLSTLVHAGLVGGTETMPPVVFEPVSMPNRVATTIGVTNNWQRMSLVTTETGARVHIYYSAPECTSGNLPAHAYSNSMMCYPVLSENPINPSQTVTDWWHKYTVKQVSEEDINMTGAPASHDTFYEYSDGPYWHYADDDGFTKPKYRTWSQFRGYGTVKVRGGDTPGQQTLVETRYMVGMHGDRLNDTGGTRTRTVTASIGTEAVDDEDEFAGTTREQITYLGSTPITKTVSVPWMSAPTATRTNADGSTTTARFVSTRTGYTATALGLNQERGWRINRTVTQLDSQYGTIDWQQDDGLWSPTGDPSANGDEQCTTYQYNRNTTKNIHLQRRITITALPCGTNPATTDDIISDVQNSYDSATSPATMATYGLLTKSEQLKDWTPAGGTVWDTTEVNAYDTTGRILATTDIKGNTASTAYTPAVGGPLTQTVETSPAPYSWKTTTKIAPYWGHPTKSTDPNGRITEATYDPMGRTLAVWQPGWSKTTNPNTPNTRYTYTYSATKTDYPVVKTEALNAKGNYLTSYQLFDALLRPKQTQQQAVGGGWVLADTFYDTLGRAVTNYGAYKANETSTSVVPGKLWSQPEWSIRAVTKTVYDTASRATAQDFYTTDGISTLTYKWRTATAYTGDATLVTPPDGAIPTTTVTDVKGRTVELIQHNTAAGVASTGLSTKYTYNRKNQMVKTTDPLGNEWTWTFDIRGRQISAKDPDKGTTTSEYNDDNELVKTTNAGDVLVYEYDQLGRKTAVYRDSATTANKRAAWTYDSMWTGLTVRGRLATSTRYEGANTYTIKIGGYSPRYAVSDITYSIPTSLTGLGGDYTFTYGYNSTDGSPTNTAFPAGGGLAGEAVTVGYDTTYGLPNGLTTTAVGITSYVTGQTYTAFGEPSMTTRKTGTSPYVDSETTYDASTRRTTRFKVKPETAAGTVTDIGYQHDSAGNYQWIADTPQVGQSDIQCFTYDRLRRLTDAWTPATTSQCDDGPVGDPITGAEPYWQTWTFDDVGNRLTQQDHTSQTTRTYSVPAQGATAVRPHAVTQVQTQTPGLTVTQSYGYDVSGNTTARPGSGGGQTLTWDVEGRLKTVAEGANTTTNTYDADGARLLRDDTSSTTLYLPGQEMRRDKGSGIVIATRYYAFGGQVCAQRTSTAGLVWLFGDHQGTQQLAIEASAQQVTVRRQSPYGEKRSATSSPWVNQKGFVGGDIDPTGLIHIGAREYDPQMGRFASVDPILVSSDPAQFNAYQYGANNPVTYADPTGTVLLGAEGGGAGGNGAKPVGTTVCLPDCTPKPKIKKDLIQCQGICHPKPTNAFEAVLAGVIDFSYETTVGAAEGLWDTGVGFVDSAMEDGAAWGRGELSLVDAVKRGVSNVCHAPGLACNLVDTGAGIVKGVVNTFTADTSEQKVYNGTKSALTIGSLLFGFRKGSKGGPADCKVRNSFTPGTLVLLADGSNKPISQIELNDKVMTGDVKVDDFSGQHPVIALIEGEGDKDLVDVVLSNNTDSGTATVTATSGHLFYVANRSSWVGATYLRPGDELMSNDSSPVVVLGTRHYTIHAAVYNLTVAGVHTYYVLAGNTPILVHNDGGEPTSGTIARGPQGMTIQIYANDHGPAHAHLKGQGFDIQIGQNGKPLDENIQLNSRQQAFVDDNIKTIRGRIGAKMREHRLNGGGC